MSKSVNLEIINLNTEDDYAVLEDEDGGVVEIGLQHLPENLKEGRFLKFVISHTDYNPDKKAFKLNSKYEEKIPNGRQLSY